MSYISPVASVASADLSGQPDSPFAPPHVPKRAATGDPLTTARLVIEKSESGYVYKLIDPPSGRVLQTIPESHLLSQTLSGEGSALAGIKA